MRNIIRSFYYSPDEAGGSASADPAGASTDVSQNSNEPASVAPAGETPEDDAAAGDGQPPALTVEIGGSYKIGDQVIPGQELVDGYMRHADYTTKTQQAAEAVSVYSQLQETWNDPAQLQQFAREVQQQLQQLGVSPSSVFGQAPTASTAAAGVDLSFLEDADPAVKQAFEALHGNVTRAEATNQALMQRLNQLERAVAPALQSAQTAAEEQAMVQRVTQAIGAPISLAFIRAAQAAYPQFKDEPVAAVAMARAGLQKAAAAKAPKTPAPTTGGDQDGRARPTGPLTAGDALKLARKAQQGR